MRPRVHLIVSCTDRKRKPVPAELRLREIPDGPPEDRADLWWAAVEGHPEPPVPVEVLYAGDHFAVAQSCRPLLAGGRVWVASAGYGLIPEGVCLKPYAATFTPGHEDSVAGPRHAAVSVNRRWWRALAAKPKPWGSEEPASIDELAASDPDAVILFAGGGVYADALAEDLLATRGALRHPEQLLLVSAGATVNGELSENVVPLDARFQSVVGGARVSLNVRAARYILKRAAGEALRASEVRQEFEKRLQALPALERADRAPMTDDEVVAFVMEAFRRQGVRSRTVLLRELRASGRSCEQKRFAGLYETARRRWEASGG
ncbi:hypothetical protein [Deferrisoma palaeochoriense]